MVLGENIVNTTPETQGYASQRMGVALFYAVKSRHDREVTIGFYLLPPRNEIKEKIKWGVVDTDRPDKPIIDVPTKDYRVEPYSATRFCNARRLGCSHPHRHRFPLNATLRLYSRDGVIPLVGGTTL